VSASSSSRPVLTPSRASSRSIARVRPTSSPATRIARSSSGVREGRRSRPKRDIAGSVVQRVDDAAADLVDLAGAVDLDQQTALGVLGGQRLGLPVVEGHALADDLLGVVLPALDLGTLEQPGDHHLVVDDELEHLVQGGTLLLQHAVEGLDPRRSAGVAVEQAPARGVLLGEAVLDDGVGDLVRDVAAGGEDLLDLLPELRFVLDVGAEDVPRGDRGDGVVLGDTAGLSALTGTGRAEGDQRPPARNPT